MNRGHQAIENNKGKYVTFDEHENRIKEHKRKLKEEADKAARYQQEREKKRIKKKHMASKTEPRIF